MTASSLNKRLRNVIIIILSMTSILVLANGYLAWKSSQKVSAKMLEQKDRANRLEYLRQVEKQYNEEKIEAEAITSALPTTTEVSGFLVELSDFAKKTGALIEKLDFPTNTIKKEKIASFQTTIELAADTVSPIENIIKKIENNHRIFDITEVEIQAEGSGGAKATVKLKAYYKNDGKN